VSKSAWFHLLSTVAWIPLTAAIFYFGIENAVWLVLLLSIYANVKTDWGDYHAARAEEGE
jgi:hypothetical protein